MIHPDDRERIIRSADLDRKGKQNEAGPYRLKHKKKDYIYVAEQSKISNVYGTYCYQAVDIDITDSMKLRNQMKLLSEYLNDTILMVHRVNGQLKYEVVIEDSNMRKRLKLEAGELENSLNSGEFCKLIRGYDPSIEHADYTEKFINNIIGKYKRLTIETPDGGNIEILTRADVVKDDEMIEYIVSMHVIMDRNSINVDNIIL